MNCIKTASTVKRLKILNIFYRNSGKDIRFGPDVRSIMLEGVNIVTNAVAVTMGPKGRTVVIEQPYGPPTITKDGVTVAKGIDLPNRFRNIGAKLIQRVADKTDGDAGDGTTTATVLARCIVGNGMEYMSAGANPIEIRKGIMLAVDTVSKELQAISKPVDSIESVLQVATVSANGDTVIGNLIANIMDKVGKDGVVTIKTGSTFNDDVEVTDGMKIDKGFISPYFVNSKTGPKVEYENPLILFSLKKIFTVDQIIPALEISREQKRPLVVITEDINEEPLSVMLLNKLQSGLPVVAVKAPGFGDHRKSVLMDLAIATGGVVFEDDLNLIRIEDCMLESLGQAGEVLITKKFTTFTKVKGDPEHIHERLEEIKADLDKTSKEFERLQLLERLCRLQSRAAVVKIGGYSEVEAIEKKERVNDALNATRSAIAEGIVPGGGIALIRCIPSLEKLKPENSDQAIGIEIVRNALYVPCATIARNAGQDGAVVASKVSKMDFNYGYDALNDEYVNMIEKGIVDPVKIVRKALIDASGIASMLLTAEAVICDLKNIETKPKRKKRRQDGIVAHI